MLRLNKKNIDKIFSSSVLMVSILAIISSLTYVGIRYERVSDIELLIKDVRNVQESWENRLSSQRMDIERIAYEIERRSVFNTQLISDNDKSIKEILQKLEEMDTRIQLLETELERIKGD